MAIIDHFDRGWGINPKGVAYIQDDQQFSFQEVGERSCRIANKLLSLNFPKETKGAVWSGNDVGSWICTLALWRANMAWIPVNARNSVEDNHYLLETFDCEVLFYQAQFDSAINELRERLPKVKHWICIDSEETADPSLCSWIAEQPSTRPEIQVDLDDMIWLGSTGGTTGKPKGVMNTHRTVQTAMAHMLLNAPYSADEKPVNLAAAPMTHTAGILSLPTTMRGGTVVVLSKPDPQLMLAAIARHRVTELFLPPTVIYRLLDIPELNKKVDLSSLKYFYYGAAPMSVEKLKLALQVFGPVMSGGYVQTEAPGTISALPPTEHFIAGKVGDDERLSSVGRPNPLIRVEMMSDDNKILPRGETGEICVRGDLVMKGYYKDPAKTAEAITDGWLHTGDVGYIDSGGFLHITDRKRDMIISGGFNVYPSEVEQVIWGHPAVQDCAVIGVPNEKWGESVKAVIELNAGQSVSAEEIIALCKDKLGSVKAPKSVDFIAQLPRSTAGKVLKKELRAQYWQESDRKI